LKARGKHGGYVTSDSPHNHLTQLKQFNNDSPQV